MQMKVSEVMDRWTILKIKALYDEDARTELAAYDTEVAGIIGRELISASGTAMTLRLAGLMGAVVELAEANARTWENEAALRKECPTDPTAAQIIDDAEIGRRAKIIRGHNKQRIRAKTTIDKMFGQIPDRKVDHASE